MHTVHSRPEIDVKTRVHTIEQQEAFSIIESINKEDFRDFVGIIKDTSKVVDSVVTGEVVEEDLKIHTHIPYNIYIVIHTVY